MLQDLEEFRAQSNALCFWQQKVNKESDDISLSVGTQVKVL